jgi:hypothetical protein
MNAAEFFREVVESNYLEFNRNPDDVKMLWNAVVSMNTVPEFVALDRLGYAEKSAGELNCAAKAIREREPCLLALKECEETFKHVRKIKDRSSGAFTTVASSTGLSAQNPATWKIGSHDPRAVLQQALAALAALPELK